MPLLMLPLFFVREHQQHLRAGLHQRSADPERAAGPREPLLQRRVHPHSEGEVRESLTAGGEGSLMGTRPSGPWWASPAE